MASKAEIRRWLKRVRLDVKDIESVLKQQGPLDEEDLDLIGQWGMDISGAGAEINDLVGGED